MGRIPIAKRLTLLLPEEQFVHRIAALIPVTVPQGIEEAGKLAHLIGRHLQADQDAAHVAALAAVMA
ncbi:hypothetical protein D3C81_2144300 [compost metagenome]